MNALPEHPGADAALDLLLQVKVGKDFPSLKGLLSSISESTAFLETPSMRISIATYVAHMGFWQSVWLAKLEGKRAPAYAMDWKTPDRGTWATVREEVARGLDRAIELAAARPFVHALSSDRDAVNTLFQIALHDSYHIGQIVLMKRVLKSGQ